MITDQQLAERVVALGVGGHDLGYPANLPEHGYMIGRQVMSAETFVRDWRVAGALMDAVYFKSSGLFMELCNRIKHIEVRNNADLVRQITEACCDALEKDNDRHRKDE